MAGCSEKTDSWVNLDNRTPYHSIHSVPTGFDVGPTLNKISIRITPFTVPSPGQNLEQEKVAHSIFSAF